ncbi:senescence-associated family protein [Hibiscus syriacus]|uniref:Senescence-associated family protein n=1 Tax=Hibiscus syriacus TaxID=106335 RepID=A0A6A3CR96_HIBSY|nr:senescence-associated family protein [Hibiscus syriacus]
MNVPLLHIGVRFLVKEVSGIIVRVEFARRFKRPSPASTQLIVPACEPRHKLYLSNLNRKVRANHLKEFFLAFNPGYGFVSFATKKETEAAISTLDGKELMDWPLRLKLSEKTADESGMKTRNRRKSKS